VDLRLHRGGRFRAWLGLRLGGDAALGDRMLRRLLHGAGAFVLVYYLLPVRFFVVVSTEEVLLLGLAVILVLEALRLAVDLELPTVRPYESRRVASYVFYAVALVVAILLFPEPIAVAVVLGTALVDPVIGELRRAPGWARAYPAMPLILYAALALLAFALTRPWGALESVVLAATAAVVAVAVERPKLPWIDDDLAMTILPGLVVVGASVLWAGA
jgi:hypothetical protein